MASISKGELLLTGIEKTREGLEMIAQVGDSQDLMKALAGSPKLADTLRGMMKGNYIFENMVVTMVAAKNSRLSPGTVLSVINSFMDVLFDLSQPCKADTDGEEQKQ